MDADRREEVSAGSGLVVLAPVRPRAVAPGETFDYRITVVNHGPAQARNVTATDELPPALSFVGSKDGCTADGRQVTCGPVARLDPGGTASWVVTVRLDPAYTGDGSDILNQATVMSDTHDPDTANNTGPHPGAGPPDGTVERPRADLAVAKEFAGADPVVPGTVFAYTLTARNHGPSQAAGVSVTDDLPDGMAFVDSPDGCTGEAGAYGGTVVCPERAALAPDRHVAFTVRVRLAPDYTGDGSDLVNRVRAGARTDDPDPSNNTAELTGLPGEDGGPAPASADLVLTKRYELADGADAVMPGETYAYVMMVRNDGPSTARNVSVTDPLPRALSFVGSPDGCTAEGATITCGGSDRLAPGETAEYRFTVELARDFDGDCAEVDNTARAASDVHDPDPGNNVSTVGKANPGEVGGCGVPIRPLPTPSPSPTPDHDQSHTLPDTGSGFPGWLPWTSGLALAAGSGLVFRVRRRHRA
nr:LPXTG cell wall anchor domain-containing protein [Streptomyces sp. CC208A]